MLFAAVRLRLFDILAAGPRTAAVLAPDLGLSVEAAVRLLEAARALGLVELRGPGRYGLGSLGAALRGNPSIAAMVAHHALLYADLADPVALLRGESRPGALAAYWPYAGGDPATGLDDAAVAPYTALMSASQAMIAAEVLDAFPLRGRRRLLDVGGGDGAFLRAAAARDPRLSVMLFDLPAVVQRARARFAEAGLGQRAECFGGDFLVDDLPRGADAASLVRVVHDHDEAGALALLRAVRAALPSGAPLLVAEPMAGTPGAEPVGAAYFGFYLLAMGRGRPRTEPELRTLMREAGLTRIERIGTRMPMLTSLLVGRA